MFKKFFIFCIIILIFAAIGGYFLFSSRQRLRQQRQIAKAPEAQITVIEGWGNAQIADYLQQKNLLKAQDFLSAAEKFDASDYPILLSKPKTAGLEGFLFPDTYRVAIYQNNQTAQANEIIKKMLDNFSQKFTADMQQQAATQKMTVYQIITLASIIEKESGHAQDKTTISGVFYNRINAKMPLQSDATVAFSQAQNLPDYNTYNNPGLPPGPICNPSLSSITAALNPVASDYFYFLTDPKTGQAVFAKTYDEHLINKQKYLK